MAAVVAASPALDLKAQNSKAALPSLGKGNGPSALADGANNGVGDCFSSTQVQPPSAPVASKMRSFLPGQPLEQHDPVCFARWRSQRPCPHNPIWRG